MLYIKARKIFSGPYSIAFHSGTGRFLILLNTSSKPFSISFLEYCHLNVKILNRGLTKYLIV